MVLCWAVSRFSKEELQRKIAGEPQSRQWPAPRFNVTMKTVEFNTVTIGKLCGKSASQTLQVSVPMMTNEVAIKKNEQLIMEHTAKAAPKKRKEMTWKDEVAAAKAKAKTKPKSAPPARGLEIQSEV